MARSILVGFETDACTGNEGAMGRLISRHQPDMIVGSVHDVHDHLFDNHLDDYKRAIELSVGIEALYCDYFDKQLDLIERFRRAVVGNFDLIRIHDPDYMQRWEVPMVRDRALRNLDRIKNLGLILDLNVRALSKSADEPYVSAALMEYAIAEGIQISPGDDSHGVNSVGANLVRGVEIFKARCGRTDSPKPLLRRHVCLPCIVLGVRHTHVVRRNFPCLQAMDVDSPYSRMSAGPSSMSCWSARSRQGYRVCATHAVSPGVFGSRRCVIFGRDHRLGLASLRHGQ